MRGYRYSQVAPVDMFKEKNTRTNLPAQIDLYATAGSAYNFLYIAKVSTTRHEASLRP
jgi:fumarate hydratase, class I